ncbi:hypothetical protein BS78_03G379600 [Paspalum vaginatum]|nr:hypothetical protein BS78_03G379600 [Paspalum vaginatum]
MAKTNLPFPSLHQDSGRCLLLLGDPDCIWAPGPTGRSPDSTSAPSWWPSSRVASGWPMGACLNQLITNWPIGLVHDYLMFGKAAGTGGHEMRRTGAQCPGRPVLLLLRQLLDCRVLMMRPEGGSGRESCRLFYRCLSQTSFPCCHAHPPR